MTPAKKTAHVFFAAICAAVVFMDMGPMALAGLFSYLILDYAYRFLSRFLGDKMARASAVLWFLISAALGSWAFQRFLRLAIKHAPLILTSLLPQLRDAAERLSLPLEVEDLHSLHTMFMQIFRDNFHSISQGSAVLTQGFFLVAGGVLVAVLWFVSPGRRHEREGFLGEVRGELGAQAASFMDGFEKIFGAQILTSLINSFLTVFLLLLLGFPYLEFLGLATFILGVIPIVGPLAANILIVGTALTLSLRLAVTVLGLLMLLHAAESVVASRIWGSRLDLSMWAILLAILVGEKVMGVSGMILGPAFLYFLCVQLRKIPSNA